MDKNQPDFNQQDDENYDENPFEKAFSSYIVSLNEEDKKQQL